MNFIQAVGTVWFYLDDKYEVKNRKISIIVEMIALVVGGIFTFGEWYSIITIVSAMIFVFAIWQKDVKTYRWLAVIANAMWVAYNVCIMSLLGTIAESILLFIAIVGLVRIYTGKEKKEV